MVSTTASSTSKKRRVQPPAANRITNYFSPADSQTESSVPRNVSHYNYSAPTHSPVPMLPSKVQSSLLTVGMRVRKAVPEGYKTNVKTTKLDAYIQRAMYNPSHSSEPSAPPTELIPFCGMFKVGNLAVQTFPRPAGVEQGVNVGCDENSLPSSQESADSTCTIPPLNPHKRELDEDSDSDSEKCDTFSPFPYQPGLWKDTVTQQSHPSTRTILTPKLGQKGRRIAFKPTKLSSGQENPLGSSAVDFEEAAFLRCREEVEDDFREVEMGGL
ncbi:hypothetical protein VTO42DRAFT_701 [Malbranchea cinnamomea]